ncbi:pentapeptide repeat-containing protein [Cyanobacterium sp. Dongsha4]|uniref:pentapeptide repeat-containing protein n=1 Tax=Cyanobacterium sp. DS4 TaxID=2878255 RepID=UPI002E800618|nr:pentapeptide repeat-containing protein [Cyanobacterium sp. Dongsha4]WVK99452.1 pentapeptide repeat-containing protein [Cyanobacterium sp. Dongsha4]
MEAQELLERYAKGERDFRGKVFGKLDLRGASLKDIDLRGAILTFSDFSDADLTGANLEYSYLVGANFTNTNLEKALLNNSSLEWTYLYKTRIDNCQGLDSKWYKVWGIVNGQANMNKLQNLDLSFCYLKEINFSNCNLQGTDFSASKLINVNFSNCNLKNSKFNFKKMQNLEGYSPSFHYHYPSIINCNFTKSDLTNAEFISADLKNLNFTDSALFNTNFSSTKAGIDPHWNEWFTTSSGYIWLKTNFDNVDFRGTKLATAIFNHTNLRGIIGDESVFENNKLYIAWLLINNLINENSKTFLEYPLDLDFVDLRDINTEQLKYINLKFANLQNSDLRGLNLSNLDLEGACLKEADLSNANLNRTNMKRVNLTKATLFEANLSQANLSDSNLSKSSLYSSIFDLAILDNAILQKCNITNANFRYSQCVKANFDNVYICYNLKANFDSANLTGTIFDNTLLNKNYQSSPIISEFNHLLTQQKDFITRYKQGYLLESPLEGSHSEITTISTEETAKLRAFSWEMVDKYKKFKQNAKSVELFVNNLTGKLGEALLKHRLGNLVTEVDYELYNYGDGGVDFTLTDYPNIGIQVKTRSGNLTEISWSISKAEIEKNSLLVCVLSEQKISEAQPNYKLIFAGFIPTSEIKIDGNKGYVKIDDLYYSGGIYSYLESLFIKD